MRIWRDISFVFLEEKLSIKKVQSFSNVLKTSFTAPCLTREFHFTIKISNGQLVNVAGIFKTSLEFAKLGHKWNNFQISKRAVQSAPKATAGQ